MITLVQEYFEEAAVRFPNKTAFCCGSETWNFAEASQFSNAFARKITQLGIKRGDFVPFMMKKSSRSILSILSILKADCAYIPIDSNSPALRTISIIETAKASVLIVDNHSKSILEETIPKEKLPILLNISDFVPKDIDPIVNQSISIDIAYVLFTSGSTGAPKGVMVPHKAIIDYIDWCVETYDLSDSDEISNHAPLYFDNSTFDLYTAFKTGATLHLINEEINAILPKLIKWLDEHKITTFFCVPSVLTLLLKSRRLKDDSFPHLRHVICAGEVLPPNILQAWMEKYPAIQFTNMYGPTEITVDCSYYVVGQTPDENTLSIPIGKARKNMELFVRTEDGTLTQNFGSQGELLVRGTSVTYGYLNDEIKTKKAFIQNPLNSTFYDPLYCTGDLVRIETDGNYSFLGRIDDQIKFLGYRIELGEIEAALTAIDEIQECVVVFSRKDPDDDGELGALVSASPDFSAAELKNMLKSKIPAYMIPTRIEYSNEEFPRTPNGKYDRKEISSLVFRND